MDRRLRELERRVAAGDLDAIPALSAVLIKATGGRDPRIDPCPGDEVWGQVGPARLSVVGRRVVTCKEFRRYASDMGVRPSWQQGRNGAVLQRCYIEHGPDGRYAPVDSTGRIHWIRAKGRFQRLGLPYLSSWRRWAADGLVVAVGPTVEATPPACDPLPEATLEALRDQLGR